MTASASVCAVLGDVIWCLGIGCLLGAGRDGLSLALGRGKLRDLAGDMLAFAAAAVLVAGFSAGSSATGSTRWYMSLAVLLGAVCWFIVAVPVVHSVGESLVRLTLRPLQLLHRLLFAPISAEIKLQQQKIFHFLSKKCRKPQKTGKKQLQNPTKILYN